MRLKRLACYMLLLALGIGTLGCGQTREEGEYKDGKQEGLWTYWDENGQKTGEGEYKDGKREGLGTYWHANGQKSAEVEYRDDKEVRRTDF